MRFFEDFALAEGPMEETLGPILDGVFAKVELAVWIDVGDLVAAEVGCHLVAASA